jgi:hypothetical protein
VLRAVYFVFVCFLCLLRIHRRISVEESFNRCAAPTKLEGAETYSKIDVHPDRRVISKKHKKTNELRPPEKTYCYSQLRGLCRGGICKSGLDKMCTPNHTCNPRDTREVLQSETRRVQTPLYRQMILHGGDREVNTPESPLPVSHCGQSRAPR